MNSLSALNALVVQANDLAEDCALWLTTTPNRRRLTHLGTGMPDGMSCRFQPFAVPGNDGMAGIAAPLLLRTIKISLACENINELAPWPRRPTGSRE